MKIKSKIYAELLLESLSSVISTHPEPAVGRIEGGEKSHDKGKKFSLIAERFWNLLQKNKQYKDLPRILTELEQLYTEKNGAKVAYVQSGQELSDKELNDVKDKLEKSTGKKVIVKFEQKDITGITAKIDGKVIDLSVEDKILKLRKAFAQNG